jgi:flagellar biosynthesis protein FlgN
MDQLAYVVGQEEVVLKQFINALTDEQNALKSGNADALDGIVDTKNRQIESLGRLAQQRNQLLRKAGFAIDRDGLRAWGQNTAQTGLIDVFLQTADEARELNRVNGQLIAMRLNSTQAALAALTPHRAPSQGLYGPKGQTSFTTGYRLIDTV